MHEALNHAKIGAPGPDGAIAEKLRVTARERIGGRRARIGIAVIAAVLLAALSSLPLAIFWLASVFATQIMMDVLWKRVLREENAELETRNFLLVLCASGALAGLVYGSYAVIAWYADFSGARVFAAIWLCGGMIHVVMKMHHEKASCFSAVAPHAALLLGLPILSLLQGGGAEARFEGLVVFIGGALYVAHMAGAFRSFASLTRELQEARARADDEKRAAEEADAVKSGLLAHVSHELRTPLNGVLGIADAMNAGPLESAQRKKLEIIRDNSDFLIGILNELLDYSRMEAGRVDFEVAPFDIEETAQAVCDLHAPRAAANGVSMQVRCVGESAALRMGDKHRVAQILQNLVGNAVKFTERGSITVTVETRADDLTISVADTGPGIAPDEAARLFTPFIQGKSARGAKQAGSGLGLATVRRLANAMGGEASVTSVLGEGSTFQARLALPALSETSLREAG